MAKRRVVKTRPAAAETMAESVEPLIVALAGQLGTLLGKARGTADGWLESPAVRQQVSQIRDGATQLLERVNRAGTAAARSAQQMLPKKKAAKKAKKSAAARHRTTQSTTELFDPRLGEPAGNAVRQKAKRRPRGRA